MNNKEIIKKALKSLFEDYQGKNSEFMNYFSPAFTIWANGKTSNFNDLLNHFDNLQDSVPNRTIQFIDLISNDECVFSQHVVTIFNDNNIVDEVDVFSKWTVANGLIIRCDELTRHR